MHACVYLCSCSFIASTSAERWACIAVECMVLGGREVDPLAPDSKQTGPVDCPTWWHGCCRGAARYLENQAAAKDANEMVPSARVHVAHVRRWEDEEPMKWRRAVMSLVVQAGGKRGKECRQLAQDHLEEVASWASVETISDVVMLDEDEFIAHHVHHKLWTKERAAHEFARLVDDPNIDCEYDDEDGATVVPVKLPKKYRGKVGRGSKKAQVTSRPLLNQGDVARSSRQLDLRGPDLASLGGQAANMFRPGAAYQGRGIRAAASASGGPSQEGGGQGGEPQDEFDSFDMMFSRRAALGFGGRGAGPAAGSGGGGTPRYAAPSPHHNQQRDSPLAQPQPGTPPPPPAPAGPAGSGGHEAAGVAQVQPSPQQPQTVWTGPTLATAKRQLVAKAQLFLTDLGKIAKKGSGLWTLNQFVEARKSDQHITHMTQYGLVMGENGSLEKMKRIATTLQIKHDQISSCAAYKFEELKGEVGPPGGQGGGGSAAGW